MLHLATSIARPNLVAMGTCFGKFSKSGKFKLGVTCLDWIATYAKYKVSQGCIPGVKAFKPKGGEHTGWEGKRHISLAGWPGRYLPLYSGREPEKTAVAINNLGGPRVGTRDDLSRLGWNGGIRA